MSPKDAPGELASARCELPPDNHARTKGRNGWFTPRMLHAVVRRDRDGTLVIAIRQYSRRPPANATAPSEWIMTVEAYQRCAEAMAAAVDQALTTVKKRKRRLPVITG
jgi:hypothetical protein